MKEPSTGRGEHSVNGSNVLQLLSSRPPFLLRRSPRSEIGILASTSSQSSPFRDTDAVIPPVQRLWFAFFEGSRGGRCTAFIRVSSNMLDEPQLEPGPQEAAGLWSAVPGSRPVNPKLTGTCTVRRRRDFRSGVGTLFLKRVI